MTDVQRIESSLHLGSWERQEANPDEEELERTEEQDKLHRIFKDEDQGRKFTRMLGETS